MIVRFLGFGIFSGIGWLLDFATFVILLRWLSFPEFAANFVSSYVGITFVWFATLGAIFKHRQGRSGGFLLVYWGFQFVSIVIYSQVLQMIANSASNFTQLTFVAGNSGVAAKLLVTPINLITNFIFMSFLTNYMKNENRDEA